MLGGIGLLLMQRLPQDLVTQSFGGTELGLGQLQLVWLLVALDGDHRRSRSLVRSDAWLRLYKYTWAAVGRRAAAADVRARDARSTARA